MNLSLINPAFFCFSLREVVCGGNFLGRTPAGIFFCIKSVLLDILFCKIIGSKIDRCNNVEGQEYEKNTLYDRRIAKNPATGKI